MLYDAQLSPWVVAGFPARDSNTRPSDQKANVLAGTPRMHRLLVYLNPFIYFIRQIFLTEFLFKINKTMETIVGNPDFSHYLFKITV